MGGGAHLLGGQLLFQLRLQTLPHVRDHSVSLLLRLLLWVLWGLGARPAAAVSAALPGAVVG
jgi:hypothetical protein